ncbi:virulence factor SrfB [Thiocapsa marina]|uniref:Virulence protein SrfB n=1 Tax=Thiocapsa marina 5811 TaxID=768671 RepID=F9UIR9_9GAMM|nr:virulence factor SrfB [Thiocapsa marina]EGV15900.1 virulence protein SrfB [Thiocapsa marina 5811]
MLARLDRFAGKITLVMNSGVQFLDFGLTLDAKREPTGKFVPSDDGSSVLRLVYDVQKHLWARPDQPGQTAKPSFEARTEQSLDLFDGAWLPLPLLRLNPPYRYANGPETWARGRLVALGPDERDPDGHTHRLTLAIDTRVLDGDAARRYLAPALADVQSGVVFALAYSSVHVHWFPALPWVDGWLLECLDEGAETILKLAPDDLTREKERLAHHAHYLNLLALIGDQAGVPQIKLVGDLRGDTHDQALNVDMVLDIGNSRSFGILVENHPKEVDGMKWRYELELRDLSLGHRVYREPFESRVELAQPVFGKTRWAVKSGRSGAFQWPTIGRVGPEAARLSGARRGTEGATGISSPKRYLWDTDRHQTGWRFNSANARAEIEPKAVAPPMSMLIDETGRALFMLPESERIPVFQPYYSRSSMMTFMLAEVLAQALCQINSAGQRLRMPLSDLPRHLRSIILTVPPSMPKQERDIFETRIREALGIVWKAMGWHPEDDPIDESGADSAWPPLPRVEVGWDEATCGQVVYLYNESQNNYGGQTDVFFGHLARRHRGRTARRVTLASVDIGGGTTDLVINDYRIDDAGHGKAAYIVPEQRFRDGFRIAGDDILLEVIRAILISAVERHFHEMGIIDAQALVATLIGSEHLDVRDSVLRQQLVVQIIYPAGLAVLKRYEAYDALRNGPPETTTLGELMREGGGVGPSQPVVDFVRRRLRDEGDAKAGTFDPLAIPVVIDLARIHRMFLDNHFDLGRSLRSLCEVVHRYDCDILLLTGRPSRLPGIQSLFRALLPLPPDRIIPLHQYRTGSWYPFNRRGQIGDPKTTAAVGALLCMLAQGHLPNFFLLASAFRAYSTIRHLGILGHDMVMSTADLIYPDIRLDDPDYQVPDVAFPVLGTTRLGYRQLALDRWAASPLYQVEVDKDVLGPVFRDGGRLLVWLQRCRESGQNEYLCVDRIQVEGGPMVQSDAVRLRLNTLATVGLSDDNYWLDSGSIAS